MPNDRKDILTLIPARMQATRLPGKPLADIAGTPMIVRVWQQAMAASLGPVWVATDSAEVMDVVQSAGGKAVMTESDLPSGSDRVCAALAEIDPSGQYDRLINLQGDLPELQPELLEVLADMLADDRWDLTTLVAPATAQEAELPQIVKAVVSWDGADDDSRSTPSAELAGNTGRALYFSRAAIPTGGDGFWHHIGLYGWRRNALTRFVSLPPSPLEISEKLEQLRALEAGMAIGVGTVDHAPGGIDTADDLEACRLRLGSAHI